MEVILIEDYQWKHGVIKAGTQVDLVRDVALELVKQGKATFVVDTDDSKGVETEETEETTDFDVVKALDSDIE